jgi:hypothetical protein
MSGKEIMKNKSNTTAENYSNLKHLPWKAVLGFMAVSILLNIVFEVTELTHINTYKGAPFAEKLAIISMYVGNWPSLLLNKYPYVIAGGGETVYEVSEWMNPTTLIINLAGWGLIGFIVSYAMRKRGRIGQKE